MESTDATPLMFQEPTILMLLVSHKLERCSVPAPSRLCRKPLTGPWGGRPRLDPLCLSSSSLCTPCGGSTSFLNGRLQGTRLCSACRPKTNGCSFMPNYANFGPLKKMHFIVIACHFSNQEISFPRPF